MNVLLKKTFIVLFCIVLAFITLEFTLQIGAFFIKENSWRAKTHWLTGNTRVLALGDSNTYGLYLPAEESYPAQLEKHWNTSHPELPIEIINLGYPGTNSFRLLANMPDILDTFKPDLVLLMIGFNDFWTPVEPSVTVKELTLLEKIKYHSRVYKLFYMLCQKKNLDAEIDSGDRILGGLSGLTFTPEEIRHIEKQTGLPFNDIQSKKIDLNKNAIAKTKFEQAVQYIIAERKKLAPKPDILNTVKYGDKIFSLGIAEGSSAGNSKQMEANLLSMLTLLNQRKIDYFLINYPSNHGYYPAANRKIATVAADTHSRFVDLGKTFVESCRLKPDTCPELFFYDGHATAKGNQNISETIMSALENYFAADK